MTLIVLEGLDGAGTTSQTQRLATYLRAQGKEVHATREPSDGPIGVMARQVLRGRLVLPGGAALGWDTMALLFAADRLDHVAAEVAPHLERGAVVICDRYVGSSLGYQSVSRALECAASGQRHDHQVTLDWLKAINARAPAADLTLMLNVPARVAKARRAARGGADELYETDPLQEGIATFYRTLHEALPSHNVKHVDGDRGVEEVEQTLRGLVDGVLNKATSITQ
jgi:dTMP kinase